MRILVHLMLSQRSLKLFSFHLILSSVSISYFHYSVFQFTDPVLHTIFGLLLIPSSVFFIYVWLFFIFSNSFLKTSNFSVHPSFFQVL